jgi:hypothetical protein
LIRFWSSRRRAVPGVASVKVVEISGPNSGLAIEF